MVALVAPQGAPATAPELQDTYISVKAEQFVNIPPCIVKLEVGNNKYTVVRPEQSLNALDEIYIALLVPS